MLKKYFKAVQPASSIKKRKRQPASSSSSSSSSQKPSIFKKCIICFKNIPSPNYISHVNNCTGQYKKKKKKNYTSQVSGQYIFENFLTVEEEKDLLQHIEKIDPKWEYSVSIYINILNSNHLINLSYFVLCIFLTKQHSTEMERKLLYKTLGNNT